MNTINTFLEEPPIADFIRQRALVHQKREKIMNYFLDYENQIKQGHFSGQQLPADVSAYASLDEVNRLGNEADNLHGQIKAEEERILKYEEEIAAIREKVRKQRQLVVNIIIGIVLLAGVIYFITSR